jgi:cold shock CspA family protein/peroxiredoxin
MSKYLAGDRFPDLELPDHRGRPLKFSTFMAPTPYDQTMGWDDGYPLIVVFYRGFFCTRDGAQMRKLVQFQEELAVNYCKMVCISADPPRVCGAYRYGLGAAWPFLSDEQRAAIDQLGIRDETEEEYPGCARPTTYVLAPDRRIHRVYEGWFFVARPTLEELRQDLRACMATKRNYHYQAYAKPEVLAVAVPAEYWEEPRPLGQQGRKVAKGQVEWFSIDDGYGVILGEDGERYFLRFSGIPGTGYRTLSPGSRVAFEIVATPSGKPAATNVQVLEAGPAWNPGSMSQGKVSGTNT